MGYRLEPFEAWHMRALGIADSVDGINATEMLSDTDCKMLERTDAWTLFNSEGDVVACGGTIRQWRGRHTAWMYITPLAARCMVKLTRLVQQVLEETAGRIEMTVREDFAPGHRWARLLGFEVENPPGVLKRFGPDGENHVAYVRIQ